MRAAPAVDIDAVADVRLICESCGMKWFVSAERPFPEVFRCAACDGTLVPLESSGDASLSARDRDAR